EFGTAGVPQWEPRTQRHPLSRVVSILAVVVPCVLQKHHDSTHNPFGPRPRVRCHSQGSYWRRNSLGREFATSCSSASRIGLLNGCPRSISVGERAQRKRSGAGTSGHSLSCLPQL